MHEPSPTPPPPHSPRPEAASSPPAPRPGGGGRTALVTFLTTALLGTLALLLALLLRPEWFRAEAPLAAEASGAGRGAAPLPLSPGEIFDAVSPSVVHVTTRASDLPGVYDESFVSGTASGIVWDEQGHVVTVDHLFDGNTTAATVTLCSGAQFEARLVLYDPATDLAVIRIDAPAGALTPARIPPPGHRVSVGDPVHVIACPYGLAQSLSSGVVSGLDRRIRVPSGAQLGGVIQTDAALHPGSSGGALADSLGRVIGLNAAIQSDGDARVVLGVGFAQPIDEVAAVVPGMIERGFAWFPRLGFMVCGDELAQALLVQVEGDGVPEAGAVVSRVDEGRRAAGAGLRALLVSGRLDVDPQITLKDVIVGVGDAPIRSKRDLQAALAEVPPGEPVTLRVARRDGEVEVTL